MKARALVCSENRSFSLEDVELADPGAKEIAVRTLYSGVSIGTEFALIRGKISWGPYPLCTGYQGVGVVEAVGRDVTGFEAGETVYYRGSRGMRLADGREVSCVSGTHCSCAVMDPCTSHGAAKLPPGVEPEAACMFVMPAVGLHGVDMANPRMGQTVAVHGAGLIGLGVVAACAHRGCVVVAIDIVAKRLEIARELGADHVIDGSSADVAAELRRLAPDGADVVFECTGLPGCIDRAIELCRPQGSFVWQGNYGEAPVSMKFLPAHVRRLRMFFPCDDGMAPCRRAVVKNMASGALRWERTITHRIDHADAPAMFGSIDRGQHQDILGVAIRWGN